MKIAAAEAGIAVAAAADIAAAAAADIAVAAAAAAVIDRLTICQFFSGAPDGAPYEMAFRMQTSVPDLMSTDDEPESTFEKYEPQSKKKGSFASNCILARRMAERGVRFVQLFHRGWDQHGNLPKEIRRNTDGTDQPSAALVKDLEERGMLDGTIVIFGGEFGRTIYSQGKLTKDNHGRDHHHPL